MKRALILFLMLLLAVPVFADTKITEMTEDTTPTSDDLVTTVNAPGTSPANRYVTLGNFAAAIGNMLTTISAGGAAFTVDVDGDVTAKSLTVARAAGVTSTLQLFEIPVNGDYSVTVKPADQLTADYTVTLPSATGTLVVSGGAIGAATATSLIATGLVDGLTHIESANGKTIDKLTAYYVASGTNSFIVPTPSSAGGNQYCFKNANNATNVITVIPVHESGVMLQNTANTAYCTADDKLVSGGAATDKLCIVALDATHYETFSSTGTWACTAH